MNRKKRAQLKQASTLLGQASGIVQDVLDQERYDLDSMPENLLDSERCKAMEDAIDELEDAVSAIGDASENIDRACDAGN